jgi:glycerophosphoryl diester phosphodiesterase
MGPRAVRIVAHRGASRYAPENTLAAFDLALQMGADSLETDLRVTKDGTIVLLHDTQVDRTTSGRGPLDVLGQDEVWQLDAGRWFDRRFAGQRVPSLQDFLRRFGGRRALELELKTPGVAFPALAALKAARLQESVTFTSFRFSTLRMLRLLDPTVRLGWLCPSVTPRAVAMLRALRGRAICPSGSTVTPEQVRLCRAHGLEVRAWGIRDMRDMHHALRCGVDGMTIDFPDTLARVLGRRHGSCSI